jgi:hypothetical protein
MSEIKMNGSVVANVGSEYVEDYIRKYHSFYPNASFTVNKKDVIFFEKGFIIN